VLLKDKNFIADKAANRSEGEAAFFKTYANANASFWQRMTPGITDNYLTR
jgi:hypothetical protein